MGYQHPQAGQARRQLPTLESRSVSQGLRTDLASTALAGVNAVAARQVITLQRWLSWLDANNAKGSITEIGFPGQITNPNHAGQTINNWGPVVETVMSVLDGTDIPVSQWADPTGMFMVVANSQGANSTTPRFTQAAVPLLRHRYAGVRALQAGGAAGIAPPAGYSNTNPNTGANWFPKAEWFQMVAAAGITVARLSFRWETLQPTLNGALSPTEVARIQGAVALADAAGMKVILDLHNYAEYITSTGPKKLGGGTLTQAHLVDVWTKLSNVFKGDARVYAYELMNEPTGLASASVWETASQAVVTAIRGNADTTQLLVPTYDFSAISRVEALHPVGWITDTANNFRYNVHFYMSSSSVGGDAAYDITWADEVAAQYFAGGVGHVPLAGELPGDQPSWTLPPQVGELTTPRHGLATPNALVSGTLAFTYFRARKSEDITQVRFRVNNAASVTPTLARIGVYRAGMDGSLTLLASVANDTAMFSSAATVAKTLASTWRKKAGVWYAIGALVVQGSGSLPVLVGMGGNSFEWDQWPYTAMTLPGQADLPSTVAKASLSSSGILYHSYHVLP